VNDPTQVARGPEETRGRILNAARDLFAEHGYDHVTVRAIADRARVNVALINRYFGSKHDLFDRVLDTTAVLPQVVEGDIAALPERLARYIVDRAASDSAAGTQRSAVLRAINLSGNSPEVREILARRMRAIVFEPVGERLSGPQAQPAAALVTAVLSGTQTVRQLLGPESLTSAGTEAAVSRLTDVFAACLNGLLPADHTS